jgi:hypothetical protein
MLYSTFLYTLPAMVFFAFTAAVTPQGILSTSHISDYFNAARRFESQPVAVLLLCFSITFRATNVKHVAKDWYD